LSDRNFDLSIPDQRRQAKGYCTSRGWEIVADYVEPGVSATDDKRPEFQRMIDATTTKPPAFDVIVVHSFSRFFRDQFQLEFYVRRLAKSGVRLVSITQELGDDPMSNMIRQIMALLDEYRAVHKVLTRTTYTGRHRFNTRFWKTRDRKPEAEIVEMAAPPIIDAGEFEAVQALLKTRSTAPAAARR
jgi:hypothetical protein